MFKNVSVKKIYKSNEITTTMLHNWADRSDIHVFIHIYSLSISSHGVYKDADLWPSKSRMLGFNRIVYNSTGGSSISIGAVTTAERNCSQRRFFQPLNFDLAGLRQYTLFNKLSFQKK
jgi:hypothetical protein